MFEPNETELAVSENCNSDDAPLESFDRSVIFSLEFLIELSDTCSLDTFSEGFSPDSPFDPSDNFSLILSIELAETFSLESSLDLSDRLALDPSLDISDDCSRDSIIELVETCSLGLSLDPSD